MSVENVKKFYEKLHSDENLQKEVKAEITVNDAVENAKVVAAAGRLGFAFTEEELVEFVSAAKAAAKEGELSDDQLENVAGGSIWDWAGDVIDILEHPESTVNKMVKKHGKEIVGAIGNIVS